MYVINHHMKNWYRAR